jgi:hypothetical protein
MQRPIPFGRNSSHFVHIEDNLVSVLHDMKNLVAAPTKVLWASCRLNRSKEKDSPVFAGWVEDIEARTIRLNNGHPYSPADLRFSDTNRSALYTKCLSAPVGKVIHRDWRQHKAGGKSQRLGENFYGETHRMSAPIKVKGVYAGTLNVAFLGAPDAAREKCEAKLISWAQGTNSPLVKYIQENLDFSGPKPS